MRLALESTRLLLLFGLLSPTAMAGGPKESNPGVKVKSFTRIQVGAALPLPGGLYGGYTAGEVEEIFAKNKVDLVDDDELLDLVEMELQESTSADVGGVSGTLSLDDEELALPFFEVDATVSTLHALSGTPKDGTKVTISALDADGKTFYWHGGTWTGTGVTLSRSASSTSGTDLRVRDARLSTGDDGGLSVAIELSGTSAWDVAGVSLSLDDGGDLSGDVFAKARDRSSLWWAPVPAGLGEGVPKVKVRVEDSDGGKLASEQLRLQPSLSDGGFGLATVSIDTRPLTLLAFDEAGNYDLSGADDVDLLAVGLVSCCNTGGGTWGDQIPEGWELALDNGDTVWGGVHDFQGTGAVAFELDRDPAGETWTVSVDGTRWAFEVVEGGVVILQEKGETASGRALVLSDDGGGAWTLSLTAYGTDADEVLGTSKVSLSTEKGEVLVGSAKGEAVELERDALAAAFVLGFGLDQAPASLRADGALGLLTGSVEITTTAGRSSTDKALAKGDWAGVLGIDADGDLGVGASPQDDATVARGDILIGGEPIGIEKSDADGGVISVPPVIQALNGRGTRNSASNSAQTQQAELL